MDNQVDEIDYNNISFEHCFYSNQKKLERIDDNAILCKILEKYPDFSSQTKDNLLKQLFVVMINDKPFITTILKEFDINIFDLFLLINRRFSFINGVYYIEYLQKLFKNKDYDTTTK